VGENTTVVIRAGTLDGAMVKSVTSILVTSGVGMANVSETVVTFGDVDGDIKLGNMEVPNMVDVGRIISEIFGDTTTLLEIVRISVGPLVIIGNIDVSVIKTIVVSISVIVTMGVDDISNVTDGSRGDVILLVVTKGVSGNGVIKVDNTGLDVTAVVVTTS